MIRLILCGFALLTTKVAYGTEDWNLDIEQWCTYEESMFMDCYKKIEAMRIDELAGTVERNGLRLIFRMPGTTEFEMVDSPEDCEGFECSDGSTNVSYRLYAHFPSLKKYLLKVQYWEGSAYEFVDSVTAARTELINLPTFAKPGGPFATLTDEADPYSGTLDCLIGEVSVFDISPTEITRVANIRVDIPICSELESDGKDGFILYEKKWTDGGRRWTRGLPIGDLIQSRGLWLFRERVEPNQSLEPTPTTRVSP